LLLYTCTALPAREQRRQFSVYTMARLYCWNRRRIGFFCPRPARRLAGSLWERKGLQRKAHRLCIGKAEDLQRKARFFTPRGKKCAIINRKKVNDAAPTLLQNGVFWHTPCVHHARRRGHAAGFEL
jgi:hypothetical protein